MLSIYYTSSPSVSAIKFVLVYIAGIVLEESDHLDMSVKMDFIC